MLRIVIVDDEVLIREGLSRMIEKESGLFRVVGQFPDGKDVLDSLPGLEVVEGEQRFKMLWKCQAADRLAK